MKTIVVLFAYSVFSFCQMKNTPAFYIKGQRLSVGMSKSEVVRSLAECCKLFPPLASGVEEKLVVKGVMPGHFIVPKNEDSVFSILGSVFFVGGRVAKLTRPLDTDIDITNEDLIKFVRVIKRTLPDSPNSALLSLQHQQTTNAGTDIVTFSFPDGRGMELRIVMLDKPDENNKRDFVSID